MYFIYISIQDH